MRFVRTFVPFVWLSAWALAPLLHAQQAPEAQPVELVVSAQAVQQPLLAHRLLPAEHELHDGNAAPILLRLAWEQTAYFTKVVPTFEERLRLPLDDPKLIEAGPLLKATFYEEMRRAAFRRSADWEYPIGEKPLDSILLPDVQAARQIAGRGLSAWIRYHVATGELDKAEEAIKVGFAINRHYGQTPFIVTQLVTAALHGLLLERLEELIAQPQSANYYWALSALPRPLIDFRSAVEVEGASLQQAIGGLDDLDWPRTAEQWADLDRALFQRYARYSGLQPLVDPAEMRRRAVERARVELPASFPEDAGRVSAMSDSEKAVRWLIAQNRRQTEEVVALMSLEPAAAMPALRALQARNAAALRAETWLPGSSFVENPLGIFTAALALQRRVDTLRIVEALRNYAATHAGSLPESLDQIVDTPVPVDVVSGKPFGYEVADGVATLSAPGIPLRNGGRPAIHYRIRIRSALPR